MDQNSTELLIRSVAILIPLLLFLFFIKSARNKGNLRSFTDVVRYAGYILIGAGVGLVGVGFLEVFWPDFFQSLSYPLRFLVYLPALLGVLMGWFVAYKSPGSFQPLEATPSVEKFVTTLQSNTMPQWKAERYRATIFLLISIILISIDFFYGLGNIYNGLLLRGVYFVCLPSSLYFFYLSYRMKRQAENVPRQ